MSRSYPSKLHAVINEVERDHFWFRARRELIVSVFNRYMPSSSGKRFCEIGFGTGELLSAIEKLGFQTTGIDNNAQALVHAKQHTHATLIQRSLAAFHPSKQFDAIGLFDVLEHQPDDQKFLRQCANLLQPNGFFFLTVPAGRLFWSAFDTLSGHKRRYTPRVLLPLLEDTGFAVVYWNYWNCFLSLGLLARKFLTSSSLTPYVEIPPTYINSLYYGILHIENMHFLSLRYLFGASIVVIARRIAVKK